VVLITGGARGIGAEAAEQLVARGARIVLVDRDAEALAGQASGLSGEVLPQVADVADAEEIGAAVSVAVERFGRLDVVIANAGISGPPSTVAAIDPSSFERVIEVNLIGTWRTVRAALPHVVASQGYVLTVASLAAAVPVPLSAAYAASKAGVEAFARTLRMEVAHTGTRVGVGYFGFVDTDLVRAAFAHPAAEQARQAMPRPLARPIPVAVAGSAIARAVERRARSVCAPRWVRSALALRGLGSLVEKRAARDPRLIRACLMANETPATRAAEAAGRIR
jgi:NAD(P)-dependent dehydrogenase (short-subunit alcohol dehydrogenase family)